MQLAWSRIWTRVAVSNSYDDNHYTMGTARELVSARRIRLKTSKYFDSDLLAFKQFCSWNIPYMNKMQLNFRENLLVQFSMILSPN